MTRLAELAEYKDTVISRLLGDMDVCKALKYADTGFLDQPSLSDPTELMYTHLFPHRYIPDSTTSMTTYITVDVGRFGASNYAYKSGLVNISIYTDIGLLRTEYGSTRMDYLIYKVDQLFNQQRGIGMGRLEFHEMDEIHINEQYLRNDQYVGFLLSYKPYEFN
jgi:hypothetical protein